MATELSDGVRRYAEQLDEAAPALQIKAITQRTDLRRARTRRTRRAGATALIVTGAVLVGLYAERQADDDPSRHLSGQSAQRYRTTG